MTVGTHRVLYGAPGADMDVDASCDVADATIRRGRDDPTTQPEAASATLTIPGALPADMDVGSPVAIETLAPDGWSRRFTGNVTDVVSTWTLGRNVDTGAPDVVPEVTLTAVGPLALLGRRVVGDVPWPQESDGERVARILALAAADGGLTIGVVDPGTVQILPRDVDRQDALALAQAVGTDAAGILWETRGGQISYADADHRKSPAVDMVLDACHVVMAPAYSRTTAGLVNEVSLAYGAGPTQPVWTATRDDSIARFGRYAYSTTTQLATLDDAKARASVLVTRGGAPVWNVSQLPLDLYVLDDDLTQALLEIDMHALFGLVDIPAGGPELRASLWVEGWSEHLSWEHHEITLSVSAYCRTSPAPQWDEAPATMTWDTARLAGVPMTWNDGACFGGPDPSTGRWSDVRATVTWDTANDVTWDEWEA